VRARLGNRRADGDGPNHAFEILFSVSVTEAVDVVEQAGTTRRIGQSEIQRAQARTLDEALRLLPGIFVRVGPEGVPRVDMRGLRARHVLLLIDGVPLTSTDDGQFDPSRIPAAFIREIKVTYGSSSVLYGENAMAGAIEIVTEAASAGVHAALDVDMRDAEQRTGGVRLTGGSERVAFLVAGDTFAR
jgi:outer membrane receptor for ferrienterochelin and colicin